MAARTQNRKRSNSQPVVVGVADHNGWAMLVSVAAVNGEPAVVDRRRVRLIEDGVPSQPYHHETLAMANAAAERLLRKVRRSIAASTELAFEHLSGDLSPRYRVSSMTIRQPPLDHLPETVREVHSSYYTTCRADGMLYHSAICAAARERGWTLQLHRRGEEVEKAAAALKVTTGAVERFIDDLGRKLGPPWAAEHRHAFAAAAAQLRNARTLET